MFIQTESTPNPDSLKFILENLEICSHPLEFNKNQDTTNSILAEELLKINGVESVMFNKNYISINKSNFTWEQLKASILQIIANHVNSGLPIIENEDHLSNNLENISYVNEDKNVVQKINSILISKVKPAVMQDGGDIKFVEYSNGVVYLALHGSCAGCPSATLTLKNGVENLLKHNIPEIKKVEQVAR